LLFIPLFEAFQNSMIFDEAAFLPGMEACYNAVNPVAGQIIAISSAGPGFFGDQCSL
jgi:hypothetical protein